MSLLEITWISRLFSKISVLGQTKADIVIKRFTDTAKIGISKEKKKTLKYSSANFEDRFVVLEVWRKIFWGWF